MLVGLDAKVTGNTLPATQWNSLPIEFRELIEGSGQTVGDAINQAELAVAQMSPETYFLVGGTASVITLAVPAGRNVGPEILRDGLRVSFRPIGSCPGGVITLNLNGTGAKNLLSELAANLLSGVYDGNRDVEVRYVLGSDKWQLIDPVGVTEPGKNLIDNSSVPVWQHVGEDDADIGTAREVTAACEVPGGGTSDYDQPIDRFRLMSDGDDVVTVTRDTGATAPISMDANMQGLVKLTVVTPNKKFGWLQNIESHRALPLLGTSGLRRASLSFKARSDPVTPGNLKKLRMAIISLSGGTRDVQDVTPISAWNANGTRPTLTGTHVYQGEVDLGNPSEGTWTLHTLENIQINIGGVALSNLKVFFWIDDPTSSEVGDILRISEFKLEPQVTASAYELENYATEELRCMRQYQKLGWTVGGTTDIHKEGTPIGVMHFDDLGAGDDSLGMFPLPVLMAKPPTLANKTSVGTFYLSVATGAGLFEKYSIPASQVTFPWASSRSMIRAQLNHGGIPGGSQTTWGVSTGDDVDPDGFAIDGIHVRTRL